MQKRKQCHPTSLANCAGAETFLAHIVQARGRTFVGRKVHSVHTARGATTQSRTMWIKRKWITAMRSWVVTCPSWFLEIEQRGMR